MRLRKLTIQNYKALDNVEVATPGDLLFLIGVNGAGKTSVLQALSLIRYFGEGSTPAFFKDRGWAAGDVRPRTVSVAPLRPASTIEGSRRLPARNLHISVALEQENHRLLWDFGWSYQTERTLREAIWILDPGSTRPRKIMSFPDSGDVNSPLSRMLDVVRLTLSGSVLSLASPDGIATSRRDAELLSATKSWASGITSLELLSPEAMRGGVRGSYKDIGARGEHLAGFLAALPADAKDRIVARMADFYPIRDLDTTRKRAGWIDMKIAEAFKLIGRIDIAHMSDGFLRILAICSIPEFGDLSSMVLLDEVEDGIEPHVLPQLIERISTESESQLVMTSHSPLLINYFDQDEIYVLTRDANGRTVGSRASSLPMFSKGEEYFGSGEIWANSARAAIQSALRARPSRRRPLGEDATGSDVLKYIQN